jgi:hypothetical protein
MECTTLTGLVISDITNFDDFLVKVEGKNLPCTAITDHYQD